MGVEFLKYVREVSGEFLEFIKGKDIPVRIVGNLDADGITSTAILVKAFSRMGVKFSVSVIKQITDEFLDILSREPYEIVFFVDLGSGYLKSINEKLEKDVYVLDHHFPDVLEKNVGKIRQVNPHLFDIDGTKEISASGVTYFFAKSLDGDNIDLAYLALVGAIGDIQENMGFTSLNKLILNDAEENDDVEVKETFRFYGIQTKPMHKVLEYSTNPYIPGVTGNERGAINFIKDAGIKLMNDKQYRKVVHLNKREVEKLITAIESKKTSDSGEPIVGPVFFLRDEDDDSMKKELREFSTFLNSCGKMSNPSLGIGVCVGDHNTTKKAMGVLRDYRKEVIDALNWFYSKRKSENIIEKEGYVILLAEDNIRDTIIGTLASILSKSNLYKEGTILISTAYTLDGDIKSSFRVCGDSKIDLREIAKKIVGKDGYGGGHRLAAGAVIPQEKEKEFIDSVVKVLDSL